MADTCLATTFHSVLTPHVRASLRAALEAAALGDAAAWLAVVPYADADTIHVYPIAAPPTCTGRPPLPPAAELRAFLGRATPGALAMFPCRGGVWCVRANHEPPAPKILDAYEDHVRSLGAGYLAAGDLAAHAVVKFMLSASCVTLVGGAELATFMFSEGDV